MNEDLILNIETINKKYQEEIKSLKEKLNNKFNIDILTFIIILALSSISIFGGVSVFKDFNVISILIQEILDIIPISLGVYICARLVTAFIYGFNKTNQTKIKKLENKVRKNNNLLHQMKLTNTKNINKLEQDKYFINEDFSYDNFSLERPKVKKIGSIKR